MWVNFHIMNFHINNELCCLMESFRESKTKYLLAPANAALNDNQITHIFDTFQFHHFLQLYLTCNNFAPPFPLKEWINGPLVDQVIQLKICCSTDNRCQAGKALAHKMGCWWLAQDSTLPCPSVTGWNAHILTVKVLYYLEDEHNIVVLGM